MKEYLYLEIYNDLKNDIKSGVLQNGDRLPTEKQLTEKYGVSRITAIKAMQKLEVKGYIKRIRGNGTFVTYNNLPKYPNKQLSVNVKSKNIAFMAECSNDLFIYILSAVQRLAISYGYNISIFDTSSKNVSDSDLLRTISNGDFCGIICQSSFVYDNLGEFNKLMMKNIPIVFVDGNIPLLKIPMIKSDNFAGGYNITKYLIERGHKRIGMVFSELTQENEQERFSGYLEALREYDLPFDLDQIYTIEKSESVNIGKRVLWNLEKLPLAFKTDAKEILSAENCPTAFFCAYDRLAMQFEQFAIEAGYKIPEDFSVVGYDNVSLCEQVIAPITTVDQNYSAMAERVLTLLIEMTKGESVPYENLIEPMIIERSSVKEIN